MPKFTKSQIVFVMIKTNVLFIFIFENLTNFTYKCEAANSLNKLPYDSFYHIKNLHNITNPSKLSAV